MAFGGAPASATVGAEDFAVAAGVLLLVLVVSVVFLEVLVPEGVDVVVALVVVELAACSVLVFLLWDFLLGVVLVEAVVVDEVVDWSAADLAFLLFFDFFEVVVVLCDCDCVLCATAGSQIKNARRAIDSFLIMGDSLLFENGIRHLASRSRTG